MVESTAPIESNESIDPVGSGGRTFGEIEYECIHCGTKVTSEELSQLPEIKCICGYRILKKTRPPIVKQIKSI